MTLSLNYDAGCLIASCCYRLAPSKYSVASRKQGPSTSGYGKITQVYSSRLERARRVSYAGIFVRLNLTESHRPLTITEACPEHREFEQSGINESSLFLYALPRDLTRHKNADSVMAHRIPPRLFPVFDLYIAESGFM